MSDTHAAERRTLRFAGISDMVDDLTSLAAGSVRGTGQWSPGQVVQHMADTINLSVDGCPIQAPPAARARAAQRRDAILRDGLPVGVQIPDEMKQLLPQEVDFDIAVANFMTAVGRIDQESFCDDHPFLGAMSPDEWRQFHCRHAELHFSFLHRA